MQSCIKISYGHPLQSKLCGSSSVLCKNSAVIEQKIQVKNAKFCLWWPNQKLEFVYPWMLGLAFPLDYVYWIKLNHRMKGSVHDTLILFTGLEENQSHWGLLRFISTPILHTRKCCLASATQALPLFKGIVQDSRGKRKGICLCGEKFSRLSVHVKNCRSYLSFF